MVQMASTHNLFGRHGPLRASQRASIKGGSCLHARRLEPAASDAHADAQCPRAWTLLREVLSLGQPRLGNLDGKRGCHSGFLFTPHAGKVVLRDDTASTELPFATSRGPWDCPLGEGTVALAASVSLAFLNEPPCADSASRTTDMPASRLWSTGFRGLK